MDLLKFTKSKAREKILRIYLTNSDRNFYLRELEREIAVPVGNIRRELKELLLIGLFEEYHQGNRVYYRINLNSEWYPLVSRLYLKRGSILEEVRKWISSSRPRTIPADWYCPTRDVFQARLEMLTNQRERTLGEDAYLLSAVIGEIGNNSFDHNLGQWPDVPGTFFASEEKTKIVVLADRGLGVLKTIQYVKPEVMTDKDALFVAFTETISGRKDEHRGNGLKFVAAVIKERKWQLDFFSGRAEVHLKQKMMFHESKGNLKGCLAVIKY